MSIEELKREIAELKAANSELTAENAELRTANSEQQSHIRLLQTIFNSLGEGVVATNLEGEFLVANPTAQEMAGMGPTENAAEEWSETYGTFYPDKTTIVPSTELPLYKAMQGETTKDVKLVLRNQNRPDGVFINVSGTPVFDETGSLIGGVIAMHDITQLENLKKELEKTISELQRQNALMDTVFNSISDGIVVADKDGNYVLSNKIAKKMLGHNPEDVSITHASETFGLFQPESQNLFPVDELPLARTLRGEDSDEIDIVIRNPHLPSEINTSISARPIYNENGVVNGGVAVIRDISERKAAENELTALNAQLTAQSQLLRSIFNSISDGVFVVDENGSIIMANPSAMRMADMAMPQPSIEPNAWIQGYNYFYPDKITPFPIEELPIMSAIRGEAVDDVEIFVNNDKVPDGIYLTVSGRPLQDIEGKQTGGVIVFRDVSDKVKREEALAQAFAQGRLEIVDTILHNIGNAINSVDIGVDTIHYQLTNDRLIPRFTALAEIIQEHQDNLSDYIKNDPQGQKIAPFIVTLAADLSDVKREFQETVERVRDRCRHIVDIIRTQNSYQNTSGTRKDINLNDAILGAIKMLQDSIDKRQIQIDIDCKNAPAEIRIQESQFHQMLVNLTKNSVESIDELIASREHSESPRVQFRAYIDGDFLYLDIIDNGIGIPPENIGKVFSAGFTTKTQGSGLGLHSSANFVISSGGKIQALSEGKGKGTTIRIQFRHDTVYRRAYNPTQESD